MPTVGRLFIVCGGVNFLLALKAPPQRPAPVPPRLFIPRLKQVCGFQLACFTGYFQGGLYVTKLPFQLQL